MIPKFRVWDKETKKMWNIESWHIEDEYVDLIEPSKNVADLTAERAWRKQSDIIFMQSTGLKGYMSDSHEDDEEMDVYRGDIIDIFWEEWPMGYYQENHMIGVVDKDETGTAWIIKDAKYDFDTPKPIPSEIDGIYVSMSLPDAEDLEEIFLHNFNLTSSDITILGNIYENPELLEQANEN